MTRAGGHQVATVRVPSPSLRAEAVFAVKAPIDLRLLPAALVAWAAAWLVPAMGSAGGVVLAGAFTIAALAFALLTKSPPGTSRSLADVAEQSATAVARVGRPSRSWVHPVIAALLVGSAVAAASAARVVAVNDEPVASMAKERDAAWLELVITSDAAPIRATTDRVDRVLVRARLERVRDTRVRVPVIVLGDASSWSGLVPSMRVRAFGRLSSSRRLDGTAAVVSARGRPVVERGPSGMQREASVLRAGLRDAVRGLGPAERGLVPGMVVGDTALMQPELTDQFKRAGLSHLTAVSGANLMILVGFLLGLTRAVGWRGRLPPVLALVAMAGFVVIARPQPSVLRAAVMAVIVLIATLTGRQRAGMTSLCAAVCVLLLVDPWLARSYGFALSVLATWGILVLAPSWRDRMSGSPDPSGPGGRLRRLVAESLSVPAAAQVACLPVLVMLAGQVSLVAVVANLLAAPAVAPTTVLGLLAAGTAPASAGVARTLGQLAGLPAAWIVRVASMFADLPGAVVPWRPDVLGALAVVGALGLGVLLVRQLPRHRWVLVAGAVFAAAVIARPSLSAGWPPPGWLVVACDIGQGDALVLRLDSGSGVLVDTGPDPRSVDRCLRDLGVRRLPLVVLSHFHADHVAGLPGVLAGRAVGEIVVSPLDDPAENAAHVRRWAAQAGVGVRAAAAGEVWQVGAIRITVLEPRVLLGKGQADGEGSAANNASVVLLVESQGVRMLLTGDIEPPAQAALLSDGGDLHAEVYKVPHHGSAYQDRRLLAAVQPRVVLVSVGAGNDYGQPAPSTITALQRSGAAVLRTDQRGDLAVALTGHHLRAVARGRSP